MLLQVVHCHPLTASYNHALFRVIVTALEESGHQAVATDLYREGFEPAMTAEERGSYFQPPYVGADVAAHTDLLRRVDGVIFCFPHWWFAMPAMLRDILIAFGRPVSPSSTISRVDASSPC
jgi:NAD(P)H dehydrogenase (quinone)